MNSRQTEQEDVVTSFFTSLDRVARDIRHIELPRGFTPERFRTLATIHTQGPISVTGLAKLEDVRPATISRMISSLESEGLIRRQEAKGDKRSVLISTTSRGRQMYERTNQRYLRQISKAITELDPDQVELIGDLSSLLENLSAALRR